MGASPSMAFTPINENDDVYLILRLGEMKAFAQAALAAVWSRL
jgi:hypothetical protein